jgi:hypothetical protein
MDRQSLSTKVQRQNDAKTTAWSKLIDSRLSIDGLHASLSTSASLHVARKILWREKKIRRVQKIWREERYKIWRERKIVWREKDTRPRGM